MFGEVIVIFSLHSLISKLCGNLRGMVTHFKDVLKVRALEVLLVHIRVFYHVVGVVDVALRSILWDLKSHPVALLDNGYLRDKEVGSLPI